MQQEQLLLDYDFLTLEGSLSRWQSYLSRQAAHPNLFDSSTLEIQDNQAVHFRSQRFELNANRQLLNLSNNSVLRLNTTFSGPGHRAKMRRPAPLSLWDPTLCLADFR
jgi:hypothetical protein